MTTQYTDIQFALIEALLEATTCAEDRVEEATAKCGDLATGMSLVDVVLCQNALLRIIRRRPD